MHTYFFAVNQANHQNFNSSLLHYKCWLIFMGKKQKKQPDNQIGWAVSMPFSSIYYTNQRTNLWNFCEKNWELGELKISVFLCRPFWFFFASSPWKSVNIYRLARMGRNFADYPGFQPNTTFLYYYAHNCNSILRWILP